MITLEFTANGQNVKATTDSATEAISLLSQFKAPVAEKTEKNETAVKTKRRSRTRSKAANANQPWSKAEVQALFDNRGVTPSKMGKVPALVGRSPVSVATYARFIKNPSRLEYAPAAFRSMVKAVTAEAQAMPAGHRTGLLD